MKKWQVGFVVAGSVLLAGCSHTQAPTGENMVQEVPTPVTSEEGGGVVNSIAAAMELGKTMGCNYMTNEGAQALESTVAVQGKKFKSISTVNGIKNFSLSDGETIYIWTSANNQGMKMTKTCLDDMKKNLPSGTANEVPQDPEEDFKTAQNVACKEVSSADFAVPSNVTFADQCAVLQQGLEMMKQLPAGYTP